MNQLMFDRYSIVLQIFLKKVLSLKIFTFVLQILASQEEHDDDDLKKKVERNVEPHEWNNFIISQISLRLIDILPSEKTVTSAEISKEVLFLPFMTLFQFRIFSDFALQFSLILILKLVTLFGWRTSH